MSEELVPELPVQEEVNVPEMPVQEPVKYDPNKKYTWNTDDIFVINGAEFGVILNSLRSQLATEEAARILLANRANNTIEQVLARSVEAGVIKEAENQQIMAKEMIKRKDGSVSQRGLWDNIRAAKGSGKKPTAAMLKQEKKIKAKSKK